MYIYIYMYIYTDIVSAITDTCVIVLNGGLNGDI